MTQVLAGEQPQKISGNAVVYVLDGVGRDSYLELCTTHQALSISGVPELAQSGSVSIAIGLGADNRPQILVNARRLQSEQHKFSADLLRIAKLVG